MTDEEPQYGPLMQALTEMQRKFVLAMAADPFGNAAKWARAAGYSDIKEGAKVRGHELLHNPAVEAAVLEFSRGLMASQGPIIAASALLRIAANPRHKRHVQAVEMLANRVGLHEVQEVHVRRTDQTGEALVDRIKRAAAALGVSADDLLGVNAPKLIEGQVVDAKDGS